jgi:zinc/manganese transport system permease protein
MTHFLFGPFLEFAFMRRALIACLAMALGCGPVGVLLVLRRMSLVGDAMSHAILPGAAVGFLVAGFSLLSMSLGGLLAGLAVALLSGWVTRVTKQREDASFAAFYLISLAIGVLIVSVHGSTVDLMHMLFGSILAVDNASLLLLAGISTFTLVVLALIYRPLIAECFDPRFLRSMGVKGWIYHSLFLVLVVLNLVGGFQALGTLMAVGLVMLPAAAARFWANEVWSLAMTASLIVFASGYAGLLLSYHANLASGPSIVLVAGFIYLLSLLFGAQGGILKNRLRRKHLTA